MSEVKNPILTGLEEDNTYLQPIGQTIAPPSPDSSFLPMVQGAATNRLRVAATKNIVIDRNGNATIEEEGFKALCGTMRS